MPKSESGVNDFLEGKRDFLEGEHATTPVPRRRGERSHPFVRGRHCGPWHCTGARSSSNAGPAVAHRHVSAPLRRGRGHRRKPRLRLRRGASAPRAQVEMRAATRAGRASCPPHCLRGRCCDFDSTRPRRMQGSPVAPTMIGIQVEIHHLAGGVQHQSGRPRPPLRQRSRRPAAARRARPPAAARCAAATAPAPRPARRTAAAAGACPASPRRTCRRRRPRPPDRTPGSTRAPIISSRRPRTISRDDDAVEGAPGQTHESCRCRRKPSAPASALRTSSLTSPNSDLCATAEEQPLTTTGAPMLQQGCHRLLGERHRR